MSVTGLAVFAVTYVLISTRRLGFLGLDRPAGALLGAVACVFFGVLSPKEALGAVDGNTLLLLFGVMGMGAFLSLDGFFEHMAAVASRKASHARRLLGAIVWGSGLLSAFITNDAVCILGAPFVVQLIKRHKLPPLPFLLALATAANTGSVATLVGNPQNMLCGLLGNLSYGNYLATMAPVAVAALALNHALLAWMFRRELNVTLQERALNSSVSKRVYATLFVIALSAIVYTWGGDLAWTSVGGFVVLMLLHRRDTRELWPRIDWSVLLFFSGLFVVAEGFFRSGAPDAFFKAFPLSQLSHSALSGVFLVGSNVVSNVPFILLVKEQMALLPHPALGWELLAMASTFAGNLTLLGSVANIIVSESAHDVGGLPFFAHLKVGLPLALLTTALGTLYLAWMA